MATTHLPHPPQSESHLQPVPSSDTTEPWGEHLRQSSPRLQIFLCCWNPNGDFRVLPAGGGRRCHSRALCLIHSQQTETQAPGSQRSGGSRRTWSVCRLLKPSVVCHCDRCWRIARPDNVVVAVAVAVVAVIGLRSENEGRDSLRFFSSSTNLLLLFSRVLERFFCCRERCSGSWLFACWTVTYCRIRGSGCFICCYVMP